MFGTQKRSKIRSTDAGISACVVEASVLSETGPHRQSNEDCGRVVQPSGGDQAARKGVLAIVADGMGGHEGGEVASEMATRIVGDTYISSRHKPEDALVEAFQAANREIFDLSRRHTQLAGMGTTCTAVAVVDGVAYSAHVGDSRAYLVRNGQIYRMTEDHSATMQMVKQGLITLAEARTHENRNVILRAVGTHEEIEVATWDVPFTLRPGDRLVLCSDGLHDVLEDSEICRLAAAVRAEAACRQMLTLAVDRKCTDNVTVAVIVVHDAAQINGAGLKATREASSL